MISLLTWQILTWQIFHKITLQYNSIYKDKYLVFFESFKTIIPCSICKNHYSEKLKKPEFNIQNNLNNNSLFKMTVDLHNSVNGMHNKKKWNIDESRKFYNNFHLNKKIVKTFLFNYIYYNFKKGPVKTDQLIKMITSFIYLIPNLNTRDKLIDFHNHFKLNKDNFRKWICGAMLIVQSTM
jgi:hypothetical protein